MFISRRLKSNGCNKNQKNWNLRYDTLFLRQISSVFHIRNQHKNWFRMRLGIAWYDTRTFNCRTALLVRTNTLKLNTPQMSFRIQLLDVIFLEDPFYYTEIQQCIQVYYYRIIYFAFINLNKIKFTTIFVFKLWQLIILF